MASDDRIKCMTQTLPLSLSPVFLFWSVSLCFWLGRKGQYQYFCRPDVPKIAENFPAFQLHCTATVLDILYVWCDIILLMSDLQVSLI